MAWVAAQCKERADDTNAHFYLAQLASNRGDDALSLSEFAAAADALERRADRTEKDDVVLFQSLDRLASARGAKKDWPAAIAYCQRIVPAAEKSKAPKAGSFLARAHYNIAIARADEANKEALNYCAARSGDRSQRRARSGDRCPRCATSEFKKL
jgi:hypothetical protein